VRESPRRKDTRQGNLEIRAPFDEPATQSPPAGIGDSVSIDEASSENLPEKQESIGQVPRIVKQRVVAMAVGWAPNRLKAGPNGSGVNRLDTDDILAPHTPIKAPSNGSDCVLVCARDKGPRRAEIAVLGAE